MASAKKTPAKKAPAEKKKAAPAKTAPALLKTKTSQKPAKPAKGKSKPEPVVQLPPKVGTKAPDFKLTADDGRELSLKDLRGKNVVLYFYPRDLTPGCTIQACGFRDAGKALAKRNAVVIGVSRDTPGTHTKFKAKERLPFTLLSDPTAEMIASYGSWGEKTFMGRKNMGILRTTLIIDGEGKVRKVFPKVSPKVHADEVLAALDEIN
jgi:peroxiredoxin Q/BCP